MVSVSIKLNMVYDHKEKTVYRSGLTTLHRNFLVVFLLACKIVRLGTGLKELLPPSMRKKIQNLSFNVIIS